MLCRDYKLWPAHRRANNMKNNGFYTTQDVLNKVGITRPTLYKWLKEGKIPEVMRDRNNFRLFTKESIEKIMIYKNMVKPPSKGGGN